MAWYNGGAWEGLIYPDHMKYIWADIAAAIDERHAIVNYGTGVDARTYMVASGSRIASPTSGDFAGMSNSLSAEIWGDLYDGLVSLFQFYLIVEGTSISGPDRAEMAWMYDGTEFELGHAKALGDFDVGEEWPEPLRTAKENPLWYIAVFERMTRIRYKMNIGTFNSAGDEADIYSVRRGVSGGDLAIGALGWDTDYQASYDTNFADAEVDTVGSAASLPGLWYVSWYWLRNSVFGIPAESSNYRWVGIFAGGGTQGAADGTVLTYPLGLIPDTGTQIYSLLQMTVKASEDTYSDGMGGILPLISTWTVEIKIGDETAGFVEITPASFPEGEGELDYTEQFENFTVPRGAPFYLTTVSGEDAEFDPAGPSDPGFTGDNTGHAETFPFDGPGITHSLQVNVDYAGILEFQ